MAIPMGALAYVKKASSWGSVQVWLNIRCKIGETSTHMLQSNTSDNSNCKRENFQIKKSVSKKNLSVASSQVGQACIRRRFSSSENRIFWKNRKLSENRIFWKKQKIGWKQNILEKQEIVWKLNILEKQKIIWKLNILEK